MRLFDFLFASDFLSYDIVDIIYDKSERVCYSGPIRDIPYCFLNRRIIFIDSFVKSDNPIFIIFECEV